MAGADTSKDDDLLAEVKEAFELAAEAEAENRRDALDDLKFARLGEQWPEKIRKDRDVEGRPCLTINRLPAFIRQVVNDARQNKPAITVHPVDDHADPETAEVFNGLVRHIEQSSDAEVAYDTALDFAVTGGFGYFEINTRYSSDDGFEQDLVIERVANPFSIYGDPKSTAADSSDWNRAFKLDSLSKAAWEERWPKKACVGFDGSGAETAATLGHLSGEDRLVYAAEWKREQVARKIVVVSAAPASAMQPGMESQIGLANDLTGETQIIDLEVFKANKALFDALGMKVLRERTVASHKVTQTLWSGEEELERIDWVGTYIPIVPVYGEEIFVDGRRHLRSLVRDAKDPQRMFNYWRTTSTELVALAPKAPFIGRKGAFETDAAKWATANVQTHAYIEYDGQEAPERQPFAGAPAGALQEALNASDDMKSIMGMFDASLGARSNETSGRAIMARQREGDVSTFHYIDNLSRAIRHAGRIMLDLIPKVYATPRVIRVLGPDGQARGITINTKAPVPQPVKGDDGQLKTIERIFDLGAGKYDLTVRSGPSFTSRREEAANQMIELIRAYPAAAPVIGDLLAKNLDWPGADEVAARLQAMLPAQAQGQNPEMEAARAQMQKLGELLGQAKAEVQSLKADKGLEARALVIKAFEAETKRFAATVGKDGAPYPPEQMQAAVLKFLQDAAASPDILPLASTPPAA